MSTGIFIVARLSSSRLPNKAIMEILGKPIIELMIERVRSVKMADKVVIATSLLPSDDPLEKIAEKLGVDCYRGSLDNIMARITNAAKVYNCETIIELLGDNPLVHPDLIDDVTKFYFQGKFDYAATLTKEYPIINHNSKLFSLGVRVQVYSRSAAEKYVNYPEYIGNDNKHPCAYIFEHPEDFRVGYFEAEGVWAFMNRPNLTFAVNYKKNFEMIRAIFERHYNEDKIFLLEKVYTQLDKEKYLYLLMGNE